MGKTRLALQIGREWQAAGRELVVVAAGAEAAVLGLARQVTSGPVLLMVDYTETRTGLPVLLRAVAADPGPVRLLLLARSVGEWWDRLGEQSFPAAARLLAAAALVRLETPFGDVPDAVLAAAALPFFAGRLGVAPPHGVAFDLPGGRSPVLVLHREGAGPGRRPSWGLLRWARWLFDLYPAGPEGSLGSVQPDLLAERRPS